MHAKWYKYNEDSSKFEYGGTFTKDFEVIPDSDPPTDFERVDYITPLHSDPPASHGPLQMGFIYSPSPSQANVGIGIGGLVADSDSSTTDYVVSVRVVDEDNVPVNECNQGPVVGSSFLIKTVPDSGAWSMQLGTLSQSCVSGLRLELLNGSSEYLLHKGGSDVWPVPPPPGTNSPATGVPVISGAARVGETLTADASGISDDDGITNASFSYQWISSDGTTDTDIAGATGSTYTLVSPDVGKTIKVRVSFTDDADNDETLTSAATTAVAATVPSVPRSVKVEQGGTGELDVSWEEPDSNGGSSITGYKVQWKEAADDWNTAADVSEVTTTDTSYTIASLSLGVEYSVRVIATNSVGDGPSSSEATATADAQTSQQQVAAQNSPATGQPTISGTVQVGETLTADTSAIDDADGLEDAVFSYQWISVDSSSVESDIAGENGSTYNLKPTDQGKTFKVRLSFTDDSGNEETLTSEASAEVRAGASVPAAPKGLLALRYTRGMVLEWTAPEGNITGYQILRQRSRCDEELQVFVEDTGDDATTYTDLNVAEGVLYLYRIRAINSDGMSPLSNFTTSRYLTVAGSLLPPASGAPAAPRNLDSTFTRDGIELEWDAPEGEVTGYRILRRIVDGCGSIVRRHVDNTNSTDTRWLDTDVEIGTRYEYRVMAINDAGHGHRSNYTRATMGQAVISILMATSGGGGIPGTLSPRVGTLI